MPSYEGTRPTMIAGPLASNGQERRTRTDTISSAAILLALTSDTQSKLDVKTPSSAFKDGFPVNNNQPPFESDQSSPLASSGGRLSSSAIASGDNRRNFLFFFFSLGGVLWAPI
jgi:hypothetical protein